MTAFLDSLLGIFHLVMGGDPRLWRIVGLSLGVSALACVLATTAGLLIGAAVAVGRFPGRRAVLILMNTLLALPSVVVGLLVYLLLSRAGPLGEFGILFTPSAMVIAQAILVTPIVAALARQTLEDAMNDHGEQLQSLGASRYACALIVAWDERMVLFTLALVAFGRAVSEVGAVMIVGGNIDGVTRVMTTAIALETSKGDLPLALALGFVLLGVVLLMNAAVASLHEWRSRIDLRGRRVSALPVSLQRTQELVWLHGASVRLGGRTVLEAIDLAVLRGEHVALVGANGAGKTTLLRAFHGLVPLASGRRETAAETAGRIPLRMAMVFQRPFMLRASLLANIELGLRLQGLSGEARRERAMRALEQVGLAGQASRPGRALSGGQQQRAALARAWALGPDVLLLDEPTASLDPSAKREVEDLIVCFGAQGITVVMSSHNLGQVKRLSRRVVYLEAGRVRADVDTDRFFHGELPPEAALFLKGELPWT